MSSKVCVLEVQRIGGTHSTLQSPWTISFISKVHPSRIFFQMMTFHFRTWSIPKISIDLNIVGTFCAPNWPIRSCYHQQRRKQILKQENLIQIGSAMTWVISATNCASSNLPVFGSHFHLKYAVGFPDASSSVIGSKPSDKYFRAFLAAVPYPLTSGNFCLMLIKPLISGTGMSPSSICFSVNWLLIFSKPLAISG